MRRAKGRETMIMHTNDKDEDARCPFCNREPERTTIITPDGPIEVTRCSDTRDVSSDGCPVASVWFKREKWNERAGPEAEALITLRDFVEPELQQETVDPAVIVWLVMNHIDILRGMLQADAEEIARLNDNSETGRREHAI